MRTREPNKRNFIMKKDRFVAFFDAIMAIVMTIVVLEFVMPGGAGWDDLSLFWFQLLAYALSFFYLGTMWINLHSVWHHVETISRPILFVNLFMLFFASLIPFLTVYVGKNLGEKVPQVLFGADVLGRHNEELGKRLHMLRKAIAVDESIKIAGIAIGLFAFPPAVMISTFVSMVSLIIAFGIRKKKRAKNCGRG